MVDELIYSELAKSFADTGRFLVRGEATAAYGIVYPALIAPAWAIFESVPQAYAAAKAINALVMSLAAVPAYFLARRVLAEPLALAAAALTVAVPSMVYTATLMTENAFYPLFLCAALAIVLWLERPTPLRTAIVLGVSLVAYLTRQQAVALLPALLTAPLLVAGTGCVPALRAARTDWLPQASSRSSPSSSSRGRSPLGVFGAYEVAGRADYSVGEVAKWFAYHVGELSLALGVIPFAALILLALMPRQLTERDRIFVAAALSLSFWLVLVVAVFASEQTFRISERNMFYVASLFLIALLVWIERGLPRPQLATAIAVLLAAGLPLVDPLRGLHRAERGVGHRGAAAARWLVEQGLALSDATSSCSPAASCRGPLPLRPAALRARAAGARARLLRRVAVPDRRPAPLPVGAASLRRHRDEGSRLDRPLGRAGRRRGVSVDRHRERVHDLGERVLQSHHRRHLHDRACRRRGSRADAGLDRREAPATCEGPTDAACRCRTCSPTRPASSEAPWSARTGSSAWSSTASTARCGSVAFVDGLYPQDTWSGKHVTYTRHECTGRHAGRRAAERPGAVRRAEHADRSRRRPSSAACSSTPS